VVGGLYDVPRTSREVFCVEGVCHNLGSKLSQFACERDAFCVNPFKINLARLFKNFIIVKVLLRWFVEGVE
jgi:hypothetical protein